MAYDWLYTLPTPPKPIREDCECCHKTFDEDDLVHHTVDFHDDVQGYDTCEPCYRKCKFMWVHKNE